MFGSARYGTIVLTRERHTDMQASRTNVFEKISQFLELTVESERDLFKISRRGVSSKTLRRVIATLDIPVTLLGPATTMRRRMEAEGRLTRAETERLLRLARVFAEAVTLFGNEAAARLWLHSPTQLVPGGPAITPAQLAAFDAGARMLEEKILLTAHGML